MICAQAITCAGGVIGGVLLRGVLSISQWIGNACSDLVLTRPQSRGGTPTPCYVEGGVFIRGVMSISQWIGNAC